MIFIEAKSTKNKQYHHSEIVYKVLKKQCKICRTQRIKLYDAEDLLQCGEIGLLEATQRRPTHVNFEAYCVSYIRGAALNHITSWRPGRHDKRIDVQFDPETALDDIALDDQEFDRIDARLTCAALCHLPTLSREVLQMIYLDGKEWLEVQEIFGWSSSRLTREIQKALAMAKELICG